MRKIMLILIFILLMPCVIAEVECSKVFVVKFNYDNGVITYKDRVVKCGYAPDRKIQPEEGYTLDVLSMDNKKLYSFKFEVPLKLNVDSNDIKGLSGGMMILNETDFALVFPYYDKAKSIVVYNPKKYKIAEVPLIEEQFMQQRSLWWILMLILLLLIASYMVYRHYRNRGLT